MRKLNIGTRIDGSGEFAVDLNDYLTTGLRIGLFGSSGAGKGYLLGVITEELIGHGIPCIMLDAEQELWTFKERGALVIGGKHADAPFVESAAAIEQAILFSLSTATPVVFDVGLAAEAEEAEAARLGELIMSRLWAVLDRDRTEAAFICTEASIFAPQSVPRGTHRPEIMRQMFQRGRKRGLIPVVETQRMADIQKTVISQSNLSFYGYMNKATDYRAVKDELEGRPYELMRTMPQGTFYVTPMGHEVNVRERQVTHGGGGPEHGEITIRESDRVGLADVITALRDAQQKSVKADEEPQPSPRRRSADRQEIERLSHLVDQSELERDDAKEAASSASTRAEQVESAMAELREQLAGVDALREAARVVFGIGGSDGAVPFDVTTVRSMVREEIATIGPAGSPAVPVEALRERYMERAAQRLIEQMTALPEDERQALLYLIGRPDGETVSAIAQALSGNTHGGTRARWGKVLVALVHIGLVRTYGSGKARRKAAIDEWISTELGPHSPTEDDIARVRDRTISIILSEGA